MLKAKTFLSGLGLAAFALMNLPAFAQTSTPHIEKRQDRQQQRIAKGVASGNLTAQEAANLEKREAKIEADKQAAKADGKVTAKERDKLDAEQDLASRRIHNKKHN